MRALSALALFGAWAAVGCRFDSSGTDPEADASRSDVGVPDLSLSDVGPGRESPPLDHAHPPDARPSQDSAAPDLRPPTDLTPPCAGLSCGVLGCNATEKRCNRLKPSNGEAAAKAAFDLVTKGINANSGTLEINTDSGSISLGSSFIRVAGSQGQVVSGIYWDVVSQGTGYPSLSIFVVTSMATKSSVTVRVKGTRPLAIYSRGDVSIEGTIIASPNGQAAATGGFTGGAPQKPGAACFGGEGAGGASDSANHDSGGGGGGGRAAGGQGGSVPDPARFSKFFVIGGPGGNAVGVPDLRPLFGGCGGGGGTLGAVGGGGGGAIQISANGTLTIASTAVITMPGAGGQDSSNSGGGGGGGAGGAILLEAASLSVNGSLAANGGGGAGGGFAGQVGEDGGDTTSRALGGSIGDVYSSAGGDGGALMTEPGDDAPEADYNGGGGGGAAGRIRLNGKSLTVSGTISPAASQSGAVDVW